MNSLSFTHQYRKSTKTIRVLFGVEEMKTV